MFAVYSRGGVGPAWLDLPTFLLLFVAGLPLSLLGHLSSLMMSLNRLLGVSLGLQKS